MRAPLQTFVVESRRVLLTEGAARRFTFGVLLTPRQALDLAEQLRRAAATADQAAVPDRQ